MPTRPVTSSGSSVPSTALIFVSVKATGPVPGIPVPGADGRDNPATMTEFALLDYTTGEVFHGVLVSGTVPSPQEAARPMVSGSSTRHDAGAVARKADAWLAARAGRPVLMSDNPGFDAMWLAHLFHGHLGRNRFGHSSRRIGDFVAGLLGDFADASSWKALRTTPRSDSPVTDARGNAEAMAQLADFFAGVRRFPRSPVILDAIPPARRAKAYTTLTAFGRKVHSTRSGLRSTGGPATTGTVTADTGAHL